MKSSSWFVPGFCAGVLMVFIILGFAMGAAARAHPLGRDGQVAPATTPTLFTVIFYSTPTPTPQTVVNADLANARAAQNMPASSAVPAPSPTPTAAAQTTPAVTMTATSACNTVNATATLAVSETLAIESESGCLVSRALTQTFASNALFCPIARNSCAFGYLVGNLDPKLLFAPTKLLDFPDDIQLMHPAMIGPLQRLREAMMTDAWLSRYGLVVIRAYDPTSKLGATGSDRELPAQGQMVEVSLSPSITGKMFERDVGHLCVLGLQAGFDWAGHEPNPNRCRLAEKAPPLCQLCIQQTMARASAILNADATAKAALPTIIPGATGTPVVTVTPTVTIAPTSTLTSTALEMPSPSPTP